MARISTYPIDSSVSGGDMLIGTDVDNANATKNFTVSSLIAFAATNNLVPYTGATQNVNLGSYNLTANGLSTSGGIYNIGEFVTAGSPGVSGYLLTSNGPSATPTWNNGALSFVPYTGATANVNLGSYNLTTNGDLTGNVISSSGGLVIFSNGIDNTGPFVTLGTAGNANDILFSNGAGLSPYWADGALTFVPYTGATADVDLGTYELSATGVDVKTGPLLVNGSAGTSGQLLMSQGAGVNPTWINNPFGTDYGSFYSILDQTCVAGGISAMIYENQSYSDGNVQITTNGSGDFTRITFSKGGVYNIQFSAQIEKTGGTDNKLSIWLRKNGSDIANSNTHMTLKANQNYAVAAWNFFEQVNTLQYIEIMWSQDGTISLVHEPADVVIPHPATPSVILTVNKIA